MEKTRNILKKTIGKKAKKIIIIKVKKSDQSKIMKIQNKKWKT